MEIIDASQMIKFFAALVFVLALMGGLALAMRRLHEKGPIKMARERRLKIMEVLPIDSRRRAILLRRDNTEHLVILGTNGETIVESGIKVTEEQQLESANENKQKDVA